MNVLDLPRGTMEDASCLCMTDAIMYKQVWRKNNCDGVLHRLRGPAIIFLDNRELWYVEGAPYKPTAHERMVWELRKKNESA